MSKVEQAAAAEKAENVIELVDERGAAIGVSVRLKPEKQTVEPDAEELPEHARLRTIAKNVSGWSATEVDGEPWTFSQERAVALFHRFPHFADQIEAGIRKG
jgi:hypothetical protein